ncbi:Ig-like domain-containing protein, partial [Syntrophomonas palmitatica]|uniref:Ig-like domain-containing protein n=1 Tax=Syntrophomonas palmitatica TaxID=402877 RepID=UPI000A774706
MRMKRFLSSIFCMTLIFTLLPVTALAASNAAEYIFDVSEGSITVSAGTESGTLKVSYGASQTLDNIPASQEITITGETTVNTVNVSSSVTANIRLSGVNINVSGVSDSACAFNMRAATVRLTLAEGTSNTLKSGKDRAGLEVPIGASLTIDGQGSLGSYSNGWGAGIGGCNHVYYGYNSDGGTITINGGTVSASSGEGAGIGGGYEGVSGTVTINGGTVTASSVYGAGIGDGDNSEQMNLNHSARGRVTITGGTVMASSQSGAGIGGGQYAMGATVTINGGTVTASSVDGAGIGAGEERDGGRVTINGGTVAASSHQGAGIGGGYAGSGGTVTITGGSVKAQSTDGQSIGGGWGRFASGTLTNDSGKNVYLTTVTLSGVSAKTAVSALFTNLDYTYGIKDIWTDTDGKLYLYLPEGALTWGARTPAQGYLGSVVTTTDSANSLGTLEADHTPPTVTGVIPNGTDAPGNYRIAVTFSEPMSASEGTVSLDGGTTALSGGVWSDGNMKYTVPYSGLSANTTYTVTISGFQDVMGNTMSADSSHSFKTGSILEADPPALKAGVPTQVTAEVIIGSPYTLDLDSIFEDPHESTLTYLVSVNGAAYSEANANYTYTPQKSGTTTLVFKAINARE